MTDYQCGQCVILIKRMAEIGYTEGAYCKKKGTVRTYYDRACAEIELAKGEES